MIDALAIVLGSFAVALLLPTAILFVEVLFALPNTGSSAAPACKRGRVAILVPAHDEAVLLASTLRSLIPQLERSDRIVVIADNCTDETASIAQDEGAEVVLRNDPTRRGKGYALDAGIRYLASSPPDVVIIIDADCQVAPGAIERLSDTCMRSGRPVQSLYLMRAPIEGSLKTQVAEFAWVVKNRMRPLGLHRLGLPCQLMGTGMAFPWRSISAANLATSDLVEDLKLGIDLARAGNPPLFCPGALVTSFFPASHEGIQDQRARWEHGHLTTILREAPGLLWTSLRRSDRNSLALAADLCVPPLALLSLLEALVWLGSAVLYLVTHLAFPLATASLAAALLVASVMSSWRVYGRDILSARSLGLAGLYALWKIPMYVKFLIARRPDWIRSKRDAGRTPS